MKYKDKAHRWSIGTGEYRWERIESNFNAIYILEKIGNDNSHLRAQLNKLGHKKFRVILFQGRGYKDTIYKTDRWMNCRNVIGNHLSDIDRALERPVKSFYLPTEQEVFGPRIGDVVVCKRSDLLGSIGLIEGKNVDKYFPWNVRYTAINDDSNNTGAWGPMHERDFEIIDHLSEDPHFIISLPKIDEVAKSKYQENLISAVQEAATEEIQHSEDLKAFGITELIIQGTDRVLRLEEGNRVIKIICKSCGHTVKEFSAV